MGRKEKGREEEWMGKLAWVGLGIGGGGASLAVYLLVMIWRYDWEMAGLNR